MADTDPDRLEALANLDHDFGPETVRCRAGDDEQSLADDYGLTVGFVERLVKEWP